MINHETELKLQAFLDDELSAREAKGASELLTRDAEARSLFEELKTTRALLVGNELECKLPQTCDFYWSKIQRDIEREARRLGAVNAVESKPAWWVRFLLPAGVLGALVVLVAVALRNKEGLLSRLAQDGGHEIDTPLEETSSFSFRSEAAAMTVVWVDSHRE